MPLVLRLAMTVLVVALCAMGLVVGSGQLRLWAFRRAKRRRR